MLSFECDYNHGACREILDRLAAENENAYCGYGADEICKSAKEKIRAACGCPEADVYFAVGGTQTNQLVIDTALANYEGVIAATTGHVSAHEAGAIEFTGHKVLQLPGHEGKIDAGELDVWIKNFWEDDTTEHMVFPGMVYISYPTEYGTLYTREEMEAISKVCHAHGIPLYLDGARLGYGLMSEACDLTLQDIARLCDIFYIGGTKVGALFGEAIVYTGRKAPAHFVAQTKQHGALLAKGWLLGLQFDTLFTDDLYFSISRHAIRQAKVLKKALKEKGYPFFIDSPTNQIFVILENERLEQLKKEVNCSVWEKYDDAHTVVRFATSWATTDGELEQLISLL